MGRVGIGKEQASAGETLDVRRFVKRRRAKKSCVAPAQVVGQDEDQVRSLGGIQQGEHWPERDNE